MPSVLRVAVPVPLATLFDYLPPAVGEAVAGSRVLVPFGRSKTVGVVVEAGVPANIGSARLKRALRVLDDAPLLDAELMQTLAWAADYWLGAPGEAYANALPLLLREDKPLPETREPIWQLTSPATALWMRAADRRKSRLAASLCAGPLSAADLDTLLADWRAAARRLTEAGFDRTRRAAAFANTQPTRGGTRTACRTGGSRRGHRERIRALSALSARWRHRQRQDRGLSSPDRTGLGPRQAVVAAGTEIGLAPQTVRRLRERLGVPIEVLHSNLAEGERARAWLRMRSGEAKVVLGTRSAVFTPLPQAGLIIVDEEHDGSYKQQEGFRYHARDLALVRGRALHVPVVLGSATPSLESLANVEADRYHALHLRSRPSAAHPPQVQIVDMRAQRLEHGLSPALLHAVGETVTRGEQVLVFRNRRGYAPVLFCHGCGWHAECSRCEHPLTLHAAWRRLVCHHCDQQSPVPSACPVCGSTELKPQGQGTERLEEALIAHFPQVPVLRIDRETTRRRDAFEQLLDNLQTDAPAILVGTQMLAKGHDLPNLTLVAIVGVDEGLLSVDFRASERLAQLVVQVATRRTRAQARTRAAANPSSRPSAIAQPAGTRLCRSREGAAGRTPANRVATLRPPSAVALRSSPARGGGCLSSRSARPHFRLPNTLQIAGPMPAPMPLRAGRQRGQLLIESTNRRHLHAAVRPWSMQLAQLPGARKVRWSLDVDPIDLY